jgi:hypothetical protein
MRGAESSRVRLTADSPVPRRIDVARTTAGAMLACFHAARVALMAMRTNLSRAAQHGPDLLAELPKIKRASVGPERT